jgi:hypothetical protein
MNLAFFFFCVTEAETVFLLEYEGIGPIRRGRDRFHKGVRKNWSNSPRMKTIFLKGSQIWSKPDMNSPFLNILIIQQSNKPNPQRFKKSLKRSRNNCKEKEIYLCVEKSGGMWYICVRKWGQWTCSWANISITLIIKVV